MCRTRRLKNILFVLFMQNASPFSSQELALRSIGIAEINSEGGRSELHVSTRPSSLRSGPFFMPAEPMM
jgi:hypothetical protein